MFQNGLGLTIRTANPKSLWDYIWESLLSKGYLRLRSGGAYFRKVLSEFYVRYSFYFCKFRGAWGSADCDDLRLTLPKFNVAT